MKGLKKYIDRYGYHFTEELGYRAASKPKWNSNDLVNELEGRVYYNVTGSTLGDMVYMANREGLSKRRGVNYALSIVGDYDYYGGRVFKEWLHQVEDFDFTPYI